MATPPDRPQDLLVAGKKIPLPCFFPSISSTTKSDLSPADHVEILSALGVPRFLISAYDIEHGNSDHKERISQNLRQSIDNGAVIFMDSGNYEVIWKNGKSWTQDMFHNVLRTHTCHLCSSYDDPHPRGSVDTILRTVEASVVQHKQHTCASVVPIVHRPCKRSPELLPEMLQMAAEKLRPTLISIPERDLGVGFLNRIQTVRKIRLALDKLGVYCPLHLLGVGHPISLIAYAIAGADSFDGLEWCQTVADHKSGKLFHFHQGDLFPEQIDWDTSVQFDSGDYFSIYHFLVIKSNLLFYFQLMEKVREAVHGGYEHEQNLLQRYMPSESVADRILDALNRKS